MSPARLAVAVAVVLAVDLARAQGEPPCWKIPDGGAVLFAREGKVTALDAEGRACLGGGDDVADPVLFAADVAADGRALAIRPWSLPSVGVVLGLDPSWSGSERVDREFDRVPPFGVVQVRGAVHRLADGREELVATLRRRDIDACDGDADFLRVERHYLDDELSAQLVLRRRSGSQGLTGIAEFTFELRGDCTWASAGGPLTVTLGGGETWRQLEVVPARFASATSGPGFGSRIETARTAAIASVRLQLVGDTVRGADGRGNIQGPSLLALYLSGLARAGLRSDDADCARAMAALQERTIVPPAGRALALIAMSQLHAPTSERADRQAGRAPARRKVPPPLLRWLREHTDRLLDLRVPVGDGKLWPFASDVGDAEMVHSWLAVAALDEMTACGIEVEPAVFAAAARGLFDLRIDGAWPQSRRDHRGYCTADATAGAVAALAICARHLSKKDRLQAAIRGAIATGLDRLEQLQSARFDGAPLPVHHQFVAEWWLAFSLLADELPQELARLGGRDPYFEIAFLAALRQRADGLVPESVMGTPAALWLWRPEVVAPITPR